MREFDLIEWIARHNLEKPLGLLTGIGDDCAVFDPAFARRLAVTTDSLVEDVHFRRRWTSPELLGRKALAVNLSDLNAVGARPHAALLSLCLPGETSDEWIHRLLKGFLGASRMWRCPLIGGNLAGASQVQITVTAWGWLPRGEAVLRSGGREGDLLAVAGTLGLARRGLSLLREEDPDLSTVADEEELLQGRGNTLRGRCWAAYSRPEPPLQAGPWLQNGGLARCMIDLSDGLCADLGHLLSSSGLSAVLEERALRHFLSRQEERAAGSSAAHSEVTADILQAALRGGEDYALLFSLDPARAAELEDCPLPRGQQRAVIGRLEAGPPSIRLKTSSGGSRPLEMTGYQHFGDPGYGGDPDDQERDGDSDPRPGGQGPGEGHA